MLLAIMGRLDVVPTLEQAQQLKMYSQDRQLTETKMKVVLARKKPAAMQVTLKKDRLKQYFPQTYTQKQMRMLSFLCRTIGNPNRKEWAQVTKMSEKTAAIKGSPLGQDLLDALCARQLFGALDVSQSIITLKEYLVKDLSPTDLKYLYPVYFDAARVLLAECAAEFFQAGCVRITALDPLRMRYREHEARRLVLTPQDIAQLLRVLCRVQKPTHGLYLRHKAKSGDWVKHIQAVYQTISPLQ